jgi:hypothetical protein
MFNFKLARIFHEELFGQVFLKDFDCHPGQRQVKVSLRRPLAGSNSGLAAWRSGAMFAGKGNPFPATSFA